jgi:hypothetical protein
MGKGHTGVRPYRGWQSGALRRRVNCHAVALLHGRALCSTHRLYVRVAVSTGPRHPVLAPFLLAVHNFHCAPVCGWQAAAPAKQGKRERHTVVRIVTRST